jgi:lysophospholipid acyltransferase (LPLAT)-like uncharacterized protein
MFVPYIKTTQILQVIHQISHQSLQKLFYSYIHLLTNSTEQNPSRKANSSSGSQNIIRTLWHEMTSMYELKLAYTG